MDIPTLERMFASRRQLSGDRPYLQYLRSYTEISDFAEIIVTERHGFVALASGRPSDFVQNDEKWWQQAMRVGSFEGDGTFDSSAAATALEFDVAVRPPSGGRPLGVLKSVLTLRNLGDLLATTETHGGAYLQVVDRRGLVLASATPTEILQPVPQRPDIPLTEQAAVTIVTTPAGDEVVVTQPANQGAWWVIVRQPIAAADEAAAMATEISASTQEMSASTEEMASTSQDLSRRAGEQAQLVRAAADDAGRILQIAAKLALGAEEAARRNADLSALARRHKDGLDQTTVRLAKLADEVAKGAEEAQALTQATAKIQTFVAQTK